MANYHPNDELLMSFAAGQLPDALGLMIACHLEGCACCKESVQKFEALGGDILEQCSEESVSPDLLEKTLAMLDSSEEESSVRLERTAYENLVNIPRPLRRFIKSDFDSLNWSGLSKNIRELTLDIDDGRYTTKLFRIKAGQELPEHTHEGNEYTLVMSGSFSDRTCDYSEGDFILADQSTTHQPRASMDQDCICLAVMDAPLKMTGLFGRMLNPFLR
jgi:putative transcriptional regulator